MPPPSYLARTGLPVSIEDLAQHECIAGTSGSWHFNAAGQDVVHHPKGRFRCNSGQAVIHASVSGFGICQLPHFYVLSYLDHGMVTLILEKFQPGNETIWAVYPQRRHLLPKVQQVVERLELELGQAINSSKSYPAA